jgi:1,4-alpha-glucan branching enzyme
LVTRPSTGPDRVYRFVLPDGLRVPDPASRHQPEDVHGPSEVVDPLAYAWADAAWTGRPWHEAVIYELHIGTFTPEGTFRAGDRQAGPPGGARRDGHRDHAGRGIPG